MNVNSDWLGMCLTGGTMSVVLDVPFSECIWISAAVAITYTLMGGLYSVAYTDIIQLVLIFCGLVSLTFCSARAQLHEAPKIYGMLLEAMFLTPALICLLSTSAFPLF